MPNSSPPIGFRIKPRPPTAKKAIPNTEATALTVLPMLPPSRLAAAMTASLRPLAGFSSPPPSLPTASRYQPIYSMSSIYLIYWVYSSTGLQKKPDPARSSIDAVTSSDSSSPDLPRPSPGAHALHEEAATRSSALISSALWLSFLNSPGTFATAIWAPARRTLHLPINQVYTVFTEQYWIMRYRENS